MRTDNNVSFKALPPCVRVVNKNILASRELSVRELYQLRRENVRRIVDFRTSGKWPHKLKDAIVCFFLGIKRKSMPIYLDKRMPSEKEISKVENFVDSSPSRTLFHCNGGFHRTNIYTQILQLRKGEKTLPEALKYLLENGFFQIRKRQKLSNEAIQIRETRLKEIFKRFQEMFEQKPVK